MDAAIACSCAVAAASLDFRDPVLAPMLAVEKGESGRAAVRVGQEVRGDPEMFGRIVAGREDRGGFAGGGVRPARAGADQDQLAHQVGRLHGDLLGDLAADRIAQDVGLADPERADEGDGVGRHPGDRGRRLARTRADAGVVEQDHLALLRQPVRHRRVPVVHGAAEMDVHDDRHAARLAEPPIGETDAVGLDELGRGGVMGVGAVMGEPRRWPISWRSCRH